MPEQYDYQWCLEFLQHVNDDAGGTITLATCYTLAIVLELLDEFTRSEFEYCVDSSGTLSLIRLQATKRPTEMSVEQITLDIR